MTPPIIGPTIGTQKTMLPSVRPLFLNPATTANSRGPKSRAGLMAYPCIPPNDIPMATTTAPTSVVETAHTLVNKPPHQGVNPDEVVAVGAGIQGGVLKGEV